MNEKGVIDKLSYHLPQILKNPRNINNILEEAGLNSHLLRPLFCEKTPCKNILNKCLLFTPKHLTDIGFAWSDFLVNEQDFADFDSSCRWAYGEILCGDLFAFQGICGVFRAHQHYGSMMDALLSHGGATALWNHNNSEATVNLKKNAVCTFQVAPSSGMVNLDYDPVSMVTTAQNFTDWTLHKIQVPRRASHY